jgi:hypothetical protein
MNGSEIEGVEQVAITLTPNDLPSNSHPPLATEYG